MQGRKACAPTIDLRSGGNLKALSSSVTFSMTVVKTFKLLA
ncbi:hypothetical protein [Calothrix rhizosoleniae]|nr:hypothetical protein [Calothrix rhizosoleniae]